MISIFVHDIPASITHKIGDFDWAHLTYHELRAGYDVNPEDPGLPPYDKEVAYMDEEGFWRVYDMPYHKWTDISLDSE